MAARLFRKIVHICTLPFSGDLLLSEIVHADENYRMSKAIPTVTRIKTTCPRDCYDACGVVVERKDGRVSKVLGDSEHHVARGSLCMKCTLAYNSAWIDPKQRLLTLLRCSGPKGSDFFQAITWETALHEIAARLQRLISDERVHMVLR